MGDAINMVQIGRRRGFDGKLQSLGAVFGPKKVHPDFQYTVRHFEGFLPKSLYRIYPIARFMTAGFYLALSSFVEPWPATSDVFSTGYLTGRYGYRAEHFGHVKMKNILY